MKRTMTLGLLASLAAGPALAHHPLAGMPMETFAHGLLSGIGHPVLGFDHLFFVALVGIAAIFTGRAFSAPAGYLGGMLVGCLAAMVGLALPLTEVIVGASLLVLGYIVLSGRALGFNAAIAIFAGFGLFHGQAFAGSIVGQEGGYSFAVGLGYLLGLIAVQYAIAIACGWLAKSVFQASEATAMSARLSGAVVAGMGLFLSLENAEGAVFAALGLS
ncbi:MAG: HupE/UreJ family protein [Pseudomonadota bacterium]